MAGKSRRQKKQHNEVLAKAKEEKVVNSSSAPIVVVEEEAKMDLAFDENNLVKNCNNSSAKTEEEKSNATTPSPPRRRIPQEIKDEIEFFIPMQDERRNGVDLLRGQELREKCLQSLDVDRSSMSTLTLENASISSEEEEDDWDLLPEAKVQPSATPREATAIRNTEHHLEFNNRATHQPPSRMGASAIGGGGGGERRKPLGGGGTIRREQQEKEPKLVFKQTTRAAINYKEDVSLGSAQQFAREIDDMLMRDVIQPLDKGVAAFAKMADKTVASLNAANVSRITNRWLKGWL